MYSVYVREADMWDNVGKLWRWELRKDDARFHYRGPRQSLAGFSAWRASKSETVSELARLLLVWPRIVTCHDGETLDALFRCPMGVVPKQLGGWRRIKSKAA